MDTLKSHFERKSLLIVERLSFNHCNQRADETVTEYAVSCEFGATLDETLCDRFVSVIHNKACQRRLLSESNLTFARAFEIALSIETAEKDTQQLRGHDSHSTVVHKVDKYFVWQYFHTLFVFNKIITLTVVSPVYSVDPPVEQRAASLLNLLLYYCSDSVLSGVRGLISELKSEQHSLPLQYCSSTACREKEKNR